MREYKVCCKEKDPEENFIKMTEYFTEERLVNKKLAKETGDRYYDDLQNAQKTVINSGYGFLGAPGLNFNYPEGAAFVTEKGREILKTAIQWATGKEYNQWKIENIHEE
jgi:DNA polymerase elongation subunit (family B)